MAIQVQYLTDLFPEFKSTAPARLQIFIDLACDSVNVNIWGSKSDYATALLTAHMLATVGTGDGNGGKGQITSEKVGDLACTYKDKMGEDDPDALSRTQYGAEYLRCRRSLIITPLVTC